MRKLRLLSLTAVVAGVVLSTGAMLAGSAQAESTPQATLAAAVEAWNDEDAEAFVTYFTEEGLLGTTSLEDASVEAVAELIAGVGPIASAELSNLRLSGGVFSGEVDFQFAAGFSEYQAIEFTQTAEGWIISNAGPASRPIPPGVPVVDITLQEYAFNYNAAAIQAADGNFAFNASNIGEEEHEIVLFEITTDAPLGDVVDAIAASGEEEQPEGVGAIEFLGFWGPGGGGSAMPSEPLAAGRYGLICFIPSPEGVPHAFLGMVSEFEVGSGPVDVPGGGAPGPIKPPSTGDAGLMDGGPTMSWLVMAIALTLVLGGAVGVVRSRSASGA